MYVNVLGVTEFFKRIYHRVQHSGYFMITGSDRDNRLI
jgi:hypothetical protein